MKFLYATAALLCTYFVAATFRLDGGVDADFNQWPFVCRVTYSRGITQHMTGTCVLVQFGQKYYVITAGHLLAKTPPNTVDQFIENNLRIRYAHPRYASIVSGVVTIEFGSAHSRTLSRAVISVNENTLKLPLQYVDTLRDMTKLRFAYDFFTIEIQNHQWYEQRNAKFLNIDNYRHNAQQPLLLCKIAGWGLKNGVLSASLQQTEVHMLHKDKCKFYFDRWADQYRGCVSVSYIGDPICFESNPNTIIRGGDSGAPIMCEYNNKTVMAAIQAITFPVPMGGQNITINAGAPLATIKKFLELIN